MTGDPVFDRAVSRILERDSTWTRQAYEFIRQAVEHTIDEAACNGPAGHVTGADIATGTRNLALQEFGAMAPWTLRQMGIHTTLDIGKIVFVLIAEGQLSASENDCLSDFEGLFDLSNELQMPWRPRGDRLEIETIA